MSPRRAVLVGGLAALAALLAPAAPASALSCVDTETVLAEAERAFIGTLVARDGDRLTFDVAEVFRGELPDPFVVRDDLAPSWAMPGPLGTELGLVVYQIKGELLVNQCGLVPPARLREALPQGILRPAPLPPPGIVPPAPPQDVLAPTQRRLATVGASASLRVGCFGHCAGSVALRSRGGTLLARGRVDLRDGIGVVRLRLTRAARRSLADDPRLPVRLVVRLAPARRPVVHRLTLVRGRG